MHAHHKETYEKRPEDGDFYTFDWHTAHADPLHDSHLMPGSEHDVEKLIAAKHQEEKHVPTPHLDAKSTDHHEAAPKKKSTDKPA